MAGESARPSERVTEEVPCDLCQSRNSERVFQDGGFWIVRCPSCNLYFVNPRPVTALHGKNVSMGTHFGEQVNAAENHLESERVLAPEMRGWLERIAQFAPPPGRFLDIGCGTGTLLKLAAERGWSPEGVELNTSRADLASSILGVPIHRQPAEEAPLQAGSYSVISLVNVFSHLTCPSKTFRYLGNLLAPGGVLFVKTGILGEGVRKEHLWDWSVPDHLYFNGGSTLERYLGLANLGVVWKDLQPVAIECFRKETFQLRGRSALRNLVKRAVLVIPGLHWAILNYQVKVRHRDNPCKTALIIAQSHRQ